MWMLDKTQTKLSRPVMQTAHVCGFVIRTKSYMIKYNVFIAGTDNNNV